MRAPVLALLLVLTACSTAAAPPPAEPQVAGETDPLIDDVRILADDTMAGRAPGTAGSRMARSYIEYRLQEIGVDPIGETFEQPFIFTRKGAAHDGVNVVGRIEGTSRTHARRVMVVTGVSPFRSSSLSVLNPTVVGLTWYCR